MIVAKGNLKGKLNIGKEYVQPTTQQKTVTPTEQIQEVLPDINIDALSKVTVNAIPEEYLRPDEVDYLKITKTFQNIEVSCYIYKPSYTSQALTEAERILNSDDMLIPLLFELAQADANTLAENIVNMGVELIEKLLQLSAVVQDYYLASDVSEAYGLTNPLRLVLSPVSENSFSIYNFIGLFIANITIEEDEQTGEKSINLTGIQQFILPQGTTQITENGTYDVREYESAEINVVGDYNAKYDPNVVQNNGFLNEAIIEVPDIDCTGRTELRTFCNLPGLKKIKLYNTTDVTDMFNAFAYSSSLETIEISDTSNVTDMGNMCYNCRSLKAFPSINTQKLTDMNRIVNGCRSLMTFPILDTHLVTNFQYAFYGCNNLTNESLNNILYMLLHATSYTGTKTLYQVGLSQSQATTCTTLSNWQACVDAGWSTGY